MPRFIKNLSALSVTRERRDALDIIEAGLNAVATETAVRRLLKLKKNCLTVGTKEYALDKFDHVYVVGFGKASLAAAGVVEKILGRRINEGIVLDVKGGPLRYIKSLVGTHPFPSEQNVRAAGEILRILEKADSKDLIITIVSGGGSSLLCRPYGLKCAELALVTRALMRRGANITEMNTVRKHLSEILGGQFARLAYPATIIGLVFSDVPGDELGMVASGPTVLDRTTVADAARVLDKYDIIKTCSLAGCDLRETPKDKIFFRKVHNELVVSNTIAVQAMADKATALGYRTTVLGATLDGEARAVGKRLVALPSPGEAYVAAGETTVTITGKGVGGRNQELALGALEAVLPGDVVISCASDGHDNSDAAGAVADAAVVRGAASRRLDVNKYLKNNDSFNFFKQVGAQINTGLTGINVSDLMVALRKKL